MLEFEREDLCASLEKPEIISLDFDYGARPEKGK
jgi:hypothetical protein